MYTDYCIMHWRIGPMGRRTDCGVLHRQSSCILPKDARYFGSSEEDKGAYAIVGFISIPFLIGSLLTSALVCPYAPLACCQTENENCLYMVSLLKVLPRIIWSGIRFILLRGNLTRPLGNFTIIPRDDLFIVP